MRCFDYFKFELSLLHICWFTDLEIEVHISSGLRIFLAWMKIVLFSTFSQICAS